MLRHICFAFLATFCVTADADIIVTAIGDSITVGYANDAGNGRPTRLQDSFDSIGATDFTVVPVAKGGINAEWYVKGGYLSQALASNPDIVVVNLGANDSARWAGDPDSIGWFQENYNQILDGLASLPEPPEVIISTVLPFAPFDPIADPVRHTTSQAVINEINPWLIQRAEETGAFLVDEYTAWLNKPYYSTSFSDAVHVRPIYRDALAADYRDAVLTVAATAVPEPGSVLLLSTLGLVFALKRTRQLSTISS